MTVNEMSAYVADAWVEVIGPDNKVIYNEREHICYGDEAQGEKLESVINKEVDFITSYEDAGENYIDIFIKQLEIRLLFFILIYQKILKMRPGELSENFF